MSSNKKSAILVLLVTTTLSLFAESDSTEIVSMDASLLHTVPAATLNPRSFRVQATTAYGVDNALVQGIDGSDNIRNLRNAAIPTEWTQLITTQIDCRYGIHRMVDVALSLPWYTDVTGWGATGNAIGDLALSGVFVPLQKKELPLQAGIEAELVLPTGTVERTFFPRDVYYLYPDPANPGKNNVAMLNNRVYFHPTLLTSLNLQRISELLPVVIHFNIGCITAGNKEAFAIDGRLGVAVRPIRILQIGAEITGQLRPFFPNRPLTEAFAADPLRCSPSISVDLPAGLTVLLAGEFGLSSGVMKLRMNRFQGEYIYATKSIPQYGAAISLVYEGKIPHKRIVKQGSRQVVYVESPREVTTGDRDRDSVPDSLDQCPDTPEDRDAFQDEDGCPDYDNDGDQIVDEKDGCPDNPEDRDDFEDSDGCPDYDNDGDQVPDTLDACPKKAGIESNRGCPEGGLPFVRTVLSAVTFAPGKSKIVNGQEALDNVAKAMIDNPKSNIEVQVHTDNRGSAAVNATLSKKRAEEIKLYLVSKGIRAERINALGLGSEFPIADNSTDEGRAKNQRVEIRRTQ